MLVVIGCGNLNRCDDAAGVRVVHRLRKRFGPSLPADVRLFDAGTSGVEVMFEARGASALIVIDACRSGAEAGAVFCMPGAEFHDVPVSRFGLHDFRWEHALHAGRRIFGAAFPEDVTVYLVEAGTLEFGVDMTPPVERAIECICERIAARIHDRQPVGAAR